MDQLNEKIKSHAECDKNEKEEELNKSVCDKESESKQKYKNESVSDIRKIRESEENRQRHMHPDESDCYGTSSSDQCSVDSNFEDWYKRKTKCKEKCKSYSD